MVTSPPANLIVTVDTEEEGLWSGGFRAQGNTVKNIAGVDRFQQLCQRYAVRPTYLVDTPVAEDEESVERLKGYQDAGNCEIGAHLHPWCAPPFTEEVNNRNSFMLNLPEPLQREKLTRLTDLIEHRFDRRPTSFRAGRYGLDIVGANILEALGYEVDSSVIPFTSYAAKDGPDFQNAPYRPYRIGKNSLTEADPAGKLLEVPVTVGFSRPRFEASAQIVQFGTRGLGRRMRIVGILDRLNMVRRIKLSPEQADARRMKQLIRACLANQSPTLVLMLHSSSLMPGGSPYVQNQRDIDQLFDNLENVFTACRDEYQLACRTLSEYAHEVPPLNACLN